jgi:hypothetical protein
MIARRATGRSPCVAMYCACAKRELNTAMKMPENVMPGEHQ